MHPNLKQAQELLYNIGANCVNELNEVVDKLKTLTEDNKIISFSFRKNDYERSLAKKPYVLVEVLIQENNKILLGTGDLLPFDVSRLNKETLQTLDEISEYLTFLNTHCPDDLPILKKTSYFSLASQSQQAHFEKNGVTIFPEFYQNQSTSKLKI